MKTIRILLLLLGLCAAPVVMTGCKATPVQIAYKSADAVVSSVDIAMQGWADYVVAERRRIAALPPLERGSLGSDLLRKEGRVFKALGEYQSAMRSAQAAVNAAIASKGPLPPLVDGAAAALLSVIKENK
jgi:hypothetical protein